MITVTRKQWKAFAPKCPEVYADTLFQHMQYLRAHNILDTELRWCHFAATVYHETGGFTEIRENMRYTTCKALRGAWPSRFGSKTDDELKPLLKNPKDLAECVYGIESGRPVSDLGNTEPGDGYAFRGGGWFNTTGRGPVKKYCDALGIPMSPAVLDDPVATLKFAVLEWTDGKCNALADANELRKIAKVINTGSANSGVEPVGMDGRKEAFARAWKLWGETGAADTPAQMPSIGEMMLKIGLPAIGGGAGVSQLASTGTPAPAPAPTPAVLDAAAAAIKQGQEAQALIGQAKGLWAFAAADPLWVGLAGVAFALIALVGWLHKRFGT